MKLPQHNSRLNTILDALRAKGPMTVREGVAVHGLFKLPFDKLMDLYGQLVMTGCAVLDGDRYALSPEALAHFNPAPAEDLGPVVLARKADVYGTELNVKKYSLSPLGMRPGSNDYRAWPSVNAPFSTAGAK